MTTLVVLTTYMYLGKMASMRVSSRVQLHLLRESAVAYPHDETVCRKSSVPRGRSEMTPAVVC